MKRSIVTVLIAIVVYLSLGLAAIAAPPSFETPVNVSCYTWWAAVYWRPGTAAWYFIDNEWKFGDGSLDYPLPHDDACGVWLYFLDESDVGQYSQSLWLAHSTIASSPAPTFEDPVSVVYDDWWAAVYWCPGTSDFYLIDGVWKYGNGSLDYPLPHDDACGVWLYFNDGGTEQFSESVWLTHATYYAPPEIEMVSVPAGAFTMGNSGRGDDAAYLVDDELPTHTVTLSAYEIGKYEVTNAEYCEVLNWALGQGRLENSSGGVYSGGDVYTNGVRLLEISSSNCQISYSGGAFVWEIRDTYSMARHPVVQVSWYGSVAFCNWRSSMDGLTPCYDLSTSALTVPYPNGYRLPTEAEWERAAAWDGTKHWIYGFVSDTLTGKDRCNYDPDMGGLGDVVNPLGLSDDPYTSPVGWFDGVNVSPNGSVSTVNSPSPVGAYDMSGNVNEWCHDWNDQNYYDGGAMTNPTGPSSGSYRVLRGGGWVTHRWGCRSAARAGGSPSAATGRIGFRVCRVPVGG